MALTIKFTPGKVVTPTDIWTVALLNALGNPTIELEGSIGASSIADNAVTLTKLIDGILTADAPGRAKMADGYVNTAKVLDGFLSADTTGRAKMADGFLTYAKLAQDAKTTGAPARGSYRNLVVRTNVATPLSKVDVIVDDLVLYDASQIPKQIAGTSALLGIDITVSGANGLDTGAEAGSTWYYIWVIYNGSAVNGLLSLSNTAPTMPGGYTHKALVGAVRNGAPGGTATDFMRFYQTQDKVFINDVTIFTGKAGVTAYAALAGADLTAFQAAVPPIAMAAIGMAGTTSAAAHSLAVAGDNNGLGACFISLGGTNLVSGENGNMYRVPMFTNPPNLVWKADVTSAIFRLSVSGFELGRPDSGT